MKTISTIITILALMIAVPVWGDERHGYRGDILAHTHAVESPPIKQWEYTVVCNVLDEAQRVVDEKSGAGWELISVTYGPPPGSFIRSVYYCYHFKRPKQVKP